MTGLFGMHTVFENLLASHREQEDGEVSFFFSWNPPVPQSQRSQVVSSSSPTDGDVPSLTGVFFKEVFWIEMLC